ncbi:choice-of-anchor D domain-containing protein [Candidatus Binatus sp.]|uniref:choice-of-anchor D domain-containing protein n=1 Tax=Candidatus Binatus sp. TaxID=2811406 RepID=UPI003CC6CEAD
MPVKLKIHPASLNFGAVKIGSHKGPKNIAVRNPKGGKKHPGLAVLMQGVAGADGPFNVTNGCNAPLPPGGSCNISVTFAPTVAGRLKATLMIIDNAEHDPQPVTLSGRGKVK